MKHELSSGSLFLRGAIALVFVAIAIGMPGPTLLSIAILFGAYALIDGVASLVESFKMRRRSAAWKLLALQGFVGVLAGVGTMFYPGITLLVLTGIVAAWALILGAISLHETFRVRMAPRWARAISGITGVLSIALGIVMFAQPAIGVLTLLTLIATYALVSGALLIAAGVQVRRLGRMTVETPIKKRAA